MHVIEKEILLCLYEKILQGAHIWTTPFWVSVVQQFLISVIPFLIVVKYRQLHFCRPRMLCVKALTHLDLLGRFGLHFGLMTDRCPKHVKCQMYRGRISERGAFGVTRPPFFCRPSCPQNW